MKTIKTIIFSLSCLLLVAVAKAQTVDEIVAKHIDAIGGKDKLSQINSIYIESSTSVMGTDAPTKTYILSGKGYKSETDLNGQTLVNVITDKGGWMINPFAGANDPTALPDDQFKLNAGEIYVDPFLDYAANGAKVELVGQEKVGDINAFKLKYTNKYNSESFIYIDPATWYIIETTAQGNAMGQDVTITTTISNYQKTDYGIFMPNTMHIDMGQFALDITHKKIEINTDIDPKIFEMPK
jgi:outer membrane lipoprotein-sorting protein